MSQKKERKLNNKARSTKQNEEKKDKVYSLYK